MKTGMIIKKVVLGMVMAVGCSLVMGALLGLAVLNEMIPLGLMQAAGSVVVFTSVFLSCLIVIKTAPKSKLTLSAVLASGYTLLCLLIAAVLTPASEFGISWTIVLPITAALLAGLWGSRRKPRRR